MGVKHSNQLRLIEHRNKKKTEQSKKMLNNLYKTWSRNKHQEIQKSIEHVSGLETEMEVPDLCSTIGIENSVAKAIGYIRRTCSQWGGKNPCITSCDNMTFSACVCVVCDTFIIGTEEICWLSKTDLIRFKSLLGSKELEEYMGKSLSTELKEQYSVNDCDLEGLLLFPCAYMIDHE